MANLPLVHMDQVHFQGTPEFWALIEPHLPPLSETARADLERRVARFIDRILAVENAVNAEDSLARVKQIRRAAEKFKESVEWRKPRTTADAAMIALYSDNPIHKALVNSEVGIYEASPQVEIGADCILEVDGFLSRYVDGKVVEDLVNNIKPLTLARISDDIMKALIAACDTALSRLDGIRKARHYTFSDEWRNGVASVAEFYRNVSGREPTAAESEIHGYSRSPFVAIIHAIQRQLPEDWPSKCPGEEADGPLSENPSNALAKQVKRALDWARAEQDRLAEKDKLPS